MKLNELPKRKSTKDKKRVGRGHGSGSVKTSGRGMNGQKSRSGGNIPPHFHGNMLTMFRRTPKLGGFNNINRKEYVAVNIGRLNVFEDGTEVTLEKMIEAGIINKNENLIKILGKGELDKKLKIHAHAWSKSVEEKAEKAGAELVKLD